MTIRGNIVDVLKREIFFGVISIEHGNIQQIQRVKGESDDYILPGFVDAHVHIESSMLVPSEFARLAVVHGTVTTVSDPHEIANVLGVEGVHYMIANGKETPFKFNFGAPSCVPATHFETAGAKINEQDIESLLQNPDIKYLAEMMNYPGVLFNAPEVHAKIAIAKHLGKPVDGHAPGLQGEKARRYIEAGISTDHECFKIEEALDKLSYGMKIIIREGSAAKNFEELIPLLSQHADQIMFCSDDKHPDDLILGHINQLASRAVKKGYDLFDVLQAACINPVKHYGLNVGLLQPGDPADFIVTEELQDFKVKATYINGQLVAENGKTLIPRVEAAVVNNFHTDPKIPDDFRIIGISDQIRVIKAIDGAIVTESFIAKANIVNESPVADLQNDILKIAVVNRYKNELPAVAFIHGFGLKQGAIASCVGHDSHNIIAVGVDDSSICKAVNAVIAHRGGISAIRDTETKVLPLPIAGIMSNEDGYRVAQEYAEIDTFVKKELGTQLSAPFMTLSFMALLVIPELKLSDKGLFDGKHFEFTNLFI
ncbi:MAG: adenine deaminase [Saprospiraceae bacterium]|nr:adenine deaminase [Saprospiraceae bacterium]